MSRWFCIVCERMPTMLFRKHKCRYLEYRADSIISAKKYAYNWCMKQKRGWKIVSIYIDYKKR